MRLHSVVYMQISEMESVRLGLLSRFPTISVVVKYHGLVKFTPMRIINIKNKKFETISKYPILDIAELNTCHFPYLYDSSGNFISMEKELYPFTTENDINFAKINASQSLETGDILLCNRRGKQYF